MRSFLIKNTRICDPTNSQHKKVVDILVEHGVIKAIGKLNPTDVKIIDMDGTWCFPGWVDSLSYCGSPGNEEDETFESLEKTALAGGFTSIAAIFGREETSQNGSDIRSLREAVRNASIRILPIGNLSKSRKGMELAELHDMQSQGAVAFFDGTENPLQSALKPIIADYSQSVEGIVYMWPWEENQTPGAIVNQSANTTALGLKGFHSSMEGSQIAADVALFEKHEAKAYFPYVTTEEASVIAKKNKTQIFGTPIYNVSYSDDALSEFDENLKVMPPLRGKAHTQKIRKAIENGSIKAVCSNHVPLNQEMKEREFLYASFGAASLQVVGSELYKALGKDAFMECASQLLSYGGSEILGLPNNTLKEGNGANMTFFDPAKNWTLNAESNKSLSKNYPAWNKELMGKVMHVVAQGKLHSL